MYSLLIMTLEDLLLRPKIGSRSVYIYFTIEQTQENAKNNIYGMPKSVMSLLWKSLSHDEKQIYFERARLDRKSKKCY